MQKPLLTLTITLLLSLTLGNVVFAKDYRLVKTATDAKVFLVKEGRRIHIPNPQVFEAGGYKWSEIETISYTAMDKISNTALIKSPTDAKVYFIDNGKKEWIPNEETFLSSGFKWSDIILISQAQVDFYGSANFQPQKIAVPTVNATPEPIFAIQPVEPPALVEETKVPTKPSQIKTRVSLSPITTAWQEKKLQIGTGKIGIPTDLGGLRQYTATQGFDINNHNEIVGASILENGTVVPYFWKEGTMTLLPDFGSIGSAGLAINEKSQIVGYSILPLDPEDVIPGLDQGGYGHAVLWQQGVIHDLGPFHGILKKYSSTAHDINNLGQIVGESSINVDEMPEDTNILGYSHAFLWDNGVMNDLGTLGGDYSRAYAINDAGNIVGYANDAYEKQHAFFWKNGVMYDLFKGTPYENGESFAIDINASDQIIGGMSYIDDQKQLLIRSFLWDQGVITLFPYHTPMDLHDINDHGDILSTVGIIHAGEIQEIKNATPPVIDPFSMLVLVPMAMNDAGDVVVNQDTRQNKRYFINGLLFLNDKFESFINPIDVRQTDESVEEPLEY